MSAVPDRRRAPGALEAIGLTVRYGELVAVAPLDLRLEPGEMLAVTGPSGAGKSSLLWSLAGATPAAGSVLLAGRPVTDRREAVAQGIAMVPQGNALASVLTAEENLLIPLVADGVAYTEATARTRASLAVVDLEESRSHLVEELSGGQQQRVALARALALHGGVLLADEPTSDLDGTNRDRVMRALRAEADGGAIVVIATHDPEAAARADGEVRLHEGHLTWVRRLVGPTR